MSHKGPFLFTTYVASIGQLINSYGIKHHKYVDDTQLYTALVKPPGNNLQHLESGTAGLHHWFWENDLLLNSDKSEVCFVGMGQRLSRTPLPSTVTVAGCPITVLNKLKKLGVTLDAALTFEEYVNSVVKSCNSTYRVCATSAAQCLVMLLIPWRPV